jgi:uncharacterized OsmC-like protein
MIGKIPKIAFGFAHIKNLLTKGVTLPKGLQVTYPHQNNTTHVIENPLETLISCLAACEVSTIRAITSKGPTKLGTITFTRIESNYDLSHWAKGGGKDNKINDVFLEAEVETNITDEQLEKLKEQTELFCPVYQIISGSGVKVHSTWKNKKLQE